MRGGREGNIGSQGLGGYMERHGCAGYMGRQIFELDYIFEGVK